MFTAKYIVKILTISSVTGATQIEVLALRTVVPRLDALRARVSGIDKLVLTLRMQLVQQRHGGELAPPQAGELEVLLAGHGKEGVATVHQLARHLGVGVRNRAEAGGRLGRMQADGEEDLLVLLHGGVDLGGQVATVGVRGLLARGFALV